METDSSTFISPGEDIAFSGSASDWDRFVDDYWEARPGVLRNPFGSHLIRDEQALDWIRTAFSESNQTLGKEFFLNGIKQTIPTPEQLPLPGEKTFSSFTDRLGTVAGMEDYQYVLYGLGRFDSQTTALTKRAFRPLLDRLGLPAGALDTDCFFGNYKETAAGLHKDNAAVFSYVVHGTKTMLVWPFDYFADATDAPHAIRSKVRLDTVDFEPHLHAATALTGGPGDVLYWPSTYWHVSVGDGQPQMTFNTSLYFPYSPRADVDEILNLLTQPKMDQLWERFYHDPSKSPQQLAQKIPGAWQEVVDLYKSTLTSKKFEGMLLGSWMRRVSTGGFTTRPVPNSDWKITEDDAVTGNPDFPILTAPVSDEKVIVAAAGTIFTARKDGPIVGILQHCEGGGAFTVRDLLEAASASDSRSRQEALDLVGKLLQCWGLLKVASHAEPTET